MRDLKLRMSRVDATPGGDTTGPERPVVKRVRPPHRYHLGRHIAFSISEDSLQMATSLHLGTTVKLLDVSKQYFSAGDLAVPERRDRLIRQEIQHYLEQHGGRRPTIVLAITGPQTALRLITLPRMSRSDVRSAMKFEARRQLPFPIDDCWVDYRITDSITRDRARTVRAAVLAATRSEVEQHLTPFRELGIEVDFIYHTQDVIGQLLLSLSDFDSNRDYMLVDIHRRHTEIAYYHGCELRLFHVSSLGSVFLANRSDPTIFEYFAESLATELQNSLDYFGAQYSARSAQEVYIYGDLAYTDELVGLLYDRLGFGFRRFPADRLKLHRNRKLPLEDNFAVGLPAVAAAVNRSRIADLSPAPRKVVRQTRTVHRLGIAAVLLSVLFATTQWLAMTSQLRAARQNSAELQRQVAEFRSSEMFTTYNQVKTRLAANQAYLARTKENPSFLGLGLKELSRLVPEPVRLYNLEYNADAPDRNFLLSGAVTSRHTPPELVLAEFVENLAASPFYDDVVVERHVKRRNASQVVLDFSLSFRGVI